MRKAPLETAGYYHIYNRGVEKRKIFMDDGDYSRFLETFAFYKFDPDRKLSEFLDHLKGGGNRYTFKVEMRERLVDIICYSLMPNHFHLLLKQTAEAGISRFIQQISNSFTRYFNTRHKRTGHLFQGTFRSKRIKTEESLLHVSRYINLNHIELKPHLKGEEQIRWLRGYLWSSYPEYIGTRERSFLDPDVVISYFSKETRGSSYQEFVESYIGKPIDIGVEDLVFHD